MNERIARIGTRSLRISDPPWLQLGRAGSAIFIVVGCALIVAWHGAFIRGALEIQRGPYSNPPGHTGIYLQQIKPFFYFFYYTGHYPIATRGRWRDLKDDPESARAMLTPGEESPLVNEIYTVVRKGDFAQIFLFYPDMWLNGKALLATPQTFNRILAVVSLLALFVSLSLVGHRLLAVTLVVLVGSHPFALVHLYREYNIWAYSIPVGSLMLALCAPLIFSSRSRRLHAAIPLIAGVFLASVREVRTEAAAVLLTVAIACAFAPGGWRRRAALVGILLVSFQSTSVLWSKYWDAHFEESYRIVMEAGGTPFGGLRNRHHALWHPIYCGLSDFGKEKGYKSWDDRVVYREVLPIINQRHGTNYRMLKEGSFKLANREPASPSYHMKPELLPEYAPVLRDKVLSDIIDDPLWYSGVLARRAQRILDRTPPVRVNWGSDFIGVPFSGWLILPVLLMTLVTRRWDQTKLLLFYTPTSLAAFAIYSRGGMTNPSTFHLATLAVLICWMVNGGSALVEERAGKRREALAADSDSDHE